MRQNLVLREGGTEAAVRVTSMELFFDLVYVFAFTQLSELLYEHLTFLGALETTVVFLALWWGWNQTAWTTDWVDPERTPVLILLSVLMVLSLVMSASILRAFGSRGETFAITFVSMQLLRVGFMAWVFGPSHPIGPQLHADVRVGGDRRARVGRGWRRR